MFTAWSIFEHCIGTFSYMLLKVSKLQTEVQFSIIPTVCSAVTRNSVRAVNNGSNPKKAHNRRNRNNLAIGCIPYFVVAVQT